ncbi:Ferric enterobactin transport system permease protein FepG [Andreprevotia sp. IGB-42]|uniref:iron-enterobactin ABC transporter permease n=1 Tax=Andreprevotia sp. IGB-42 TaxID=2497473 RepID=UPI001357259D|nr:iron-enterobactin ABC transporter permease [Andreprevotia sp. IGB-42]KAF0812627.1 Ferric enterobactin transport system permease protein FepG [Andreprevotia sp. IGB-42]
MSSAAHAPRSWLIGHPDAAINLRVDRRNVLVCALLALCCAALVIASLCAGTLALSLHEVWAALSGEGSPLATAVVTQWRLPRAVTALVLGAALGISGAIFQSLVRNPLGSPDIISFNTGAHTGALVTIILLGGSYVEIAGGAIVGGLATALVVYALAWRRGIHGFRLIVIGIAVSAMLGAFNTWLSITGSLESALTAALWAAGSLNGMTWAKSLPASAFCVLAMAAAMLLARRMQFLEMGDDCAAALGIPAERTRLLLMALGTTLIAASTAAAGPISFIALAAPQIARRLCHNRSTLTGAAGVGAALLLAADFVAQHCFTPRQLPVGVVTVSIGGIYLVYLLIREARRS